MNELRSLVASPDGRSLYGVTPSEDAVAVFGTKPFAFAECFSGNAQLRNKGRGPCRLFPRAGTEDSHTGFNGVFSAAVSPDGRSLYTASSTDNSIGLFARARSGKLAYRGCLTGDVSKEGTGRSGVCRKIPTATDNFGATFSGLSQPASLVVSPDGRFLYAALGGEMGIATLARAADGSLAYVSCLRGGSPSVFIAGSPGPICSLVAPEEENPSRSGLRGVRSLAISPDGSSLYASSPGRGAIAEFARDAASGALAFRGCISSATRGSGPGDPCRPIPSPGEIPAGTGLWGLKVLTVSGDGRNLYAVANADEAVVQFSRDPAAGTLTYLGCLTGDEDLGFGAAKPCKTIPGASRRTVGSGLADPTDLVVSPSGRSVFVAAKKDRAVAEFDRDPATGALAWKGCVTISRVAGSAPGCRLVHAGKRVQRLGFGGFNSLAIAGRSLFVNAAGEGAISRFSLGD